jgi:hypothetical protein
MTEEEFFMGFAEMWQSISMPPAFDCFLWVSALILTGSVGTVAYIALGDAIKSIRRKVTQRVFIPRRKQ